MTNERMIPDKECLPKYFDSEEKVPNPDELRFFDFGEGLILAPMGEGMNFSQPIIGTPTRFFFGLERNDKAAFFYLPEELHKGA